MGLLTGPFTRDIRSFSGGKPRFGAGFMGLWDPSQWPFPWLTYGGDPNHLLTGMILQVGILYSKEVGIKQHDQQLKSQRQYLALNMSKANTNT